MANAWNGLGIAFVVSYILLFCFVLDRFVGPFFYYWAYALHLASDRGVFVRRYRFFSRAVGTVMILMIATALALRAVE